jgi:hypothetical protein
MLAKQQNSVYKCNADFSDNLPRTLVGKCQGNPSNSIVIAAVSQELGNTEFPDTAGGEQESKE